MNIVIAGSMSDLVGTPDTITVDSAEFAAESTVTPEPRTRSRSPLTDGKSKKHKSDVAEKAEQGAGKTSPDTDADTLTRNSPAAGEADDQNTRGRSMARKEDDSNDADDAMIALMGFSGFGTTKGKHVTAAKGGRAQLSAPVTARQFLNRGTRSKLDK